MTSRDKTCLGFLFALALVLSVQVFASTEAALDHCKKTIKKSGLVNLIRLETLVRNPRTLISSEDQIRATGGVIKTWNPKFKTSFYSTVSEPDPQGNIPLIDPKAKGLVIFVHGSGTAKASGKNFADKMNPLRTHGFAGLSFDLPYHGDNPGDPRLNNMDSFMEWMRSVVKDVKGTRKIPIFFAGHSFGPDVIQEYAARYPDDVAGLLLMSPAGDFHPALTWTYEHITTPGEKFMMGSESQPNEAGGEWAGKLANQFTWSKKSLPPHIRVKVLLGAEDEWWPGNKRLPELLGVQQKFNMDEPLQFLRAHYPNGEFNILPKVGHMLFEAVNSKGRNVMLDEMLDLVGVPEKVRSTDWLPLTPRERLKLMHETSPAFRTWIGDRYAHSMLDAKRAEGVFKDWENTRLKAWKMVVDRMASDHPEFVENRKYLHGLAKKLLNKVDAKIMEIPSVQLQSDYNNYLAHLESGSSEPFVFERDPATPPQLELPEKFFNGELKASRRNGHSPVLQSAVEEQLAKAGNQVVASTPMGKYLVKLDIRYNDKPHTEYVLKDMSREDLQALVQKAFLNAIEKNGYQPIDGNKWTGEADGIVFDVNSTEVTKVQTIMIKPAVEPTPENPAP